MFIRQAAQRGHDDGIRSQAEALACHGDWAAQSLEQNFDEPRRVAAHPFAASQRRINSGQAFAFRLMARQTGHLVNLLPARRRFGRRAEQLAQVIRLGRAPAEHELVPHQRGSPARLRGSRAQTDGVIKEWIALRVQPLRSDLHRFRLRQITRGHGGFQPHARMLITRRLVQEFHRVGYLFRPSSHHSRTVSPHARVFRREQLVQQLRSRRLVGLEDPDDLQQ